METVREESRVLPRVLVVDDDDDMRTLADIQLQDEFEVLLAGDAKQGIELASSAEPDVILLDVMMPHMTGMEALTRLLADPDTKDIPVIFLSALTSVEDRVHGLEGGAVDYITKPFDVLELRARVNAAVRRSPRRSLDFVSTGGTLESLEGTPAFESRLEEETARARRSSSLLSILLIEIDTYSKLQSAGGEAAVSSAISDVSDVLHEALRQSDSLYRFGDRAFAAVLPDTDVATAYMAAERLRASCASLSYASVPVTLSVGVAEHVFGHGAKDLLGKAQGALDKARASGGDRSWRADDPRRHPMNASSLASELTKREWDVLAHVVQRRTEQEIARRLNISSGTVRSHKARIRRKLHVRRDTRLADFARSNFKELTRDLDEIEVATES